MMHNSTNPLKNLRFAIPFDAIRAEHVRPGIESLISQANALIDEIVDAPGPRTYNNTMEALENATEALELASGVIGHLESVATYPEFRTEYEGVQPILSRFWTGITLNEGLWKALKDFVATAEAADLDRVRRRHLDLTIADFKRHGAELDQQGKARIEEINAELSEVTTRFSQHLLDSTNAFEMIIEEEEKLAGLPDSAKAAARQSAESKKKAGWRFTLQAPSILPVLTYLDDEEIRRAVWQAFNTRATDGELDNRPLIKRILQLRREKAALLGFSDFSDLVLDNRMAKGGEKAANFVNDLAAKTLKRFDKENEELEAYRRSYLGREPAPMQPWDYGYWAEKQRAELFDFDEEEVRPYFPARAALDGVFETVNRLYGVTVESTDDLPRWNPDVLTYRLRDSDGRHLASFYVDLHPREDKRSGAWMNHLVTGRNGEPHLGLMCANVNEPLGDQPALLTHREVETIFHEFGHLMHHCLSDVPVRSMAGTNVAWDFVELPSQIMENWCWEKESLDNFAQHYETGKPIPDDLFAKMLRARNYRAASAQIRQLSFATLDLALHREFDPSEGSDVMAYARELQQRFSPAQLPEDYGFLAGFSHLFSSSVAYAAGYYSYKWAEVLDADAFTRFREAGVFDREVGEEFRRKVLEKGDSADPMDLFVDFMGREPDQDSLMERLGLA